MQYVSDLWMSIFKAFIHSNQGLWERGSPGFGFSFSSGLAG